MLAPPIVTLSLCIGLNDVGPRQPTRNGAGLLISNSEGQLWVLLIARYDKPSACTIVQSRVCYLHEATEAFKVPSSTEVRRTQEPILQICEQVIGIDG